MYEFVDYSVLKNFYYIHDTCIVQLERPSLFDVLGRMQRERLGRSEVLMMVGDEVECMLKDNFGGQGCVVDRMVVVMAYGMELDRVAVVVVDDDDGDVVVAVVAVGGGDGVDKLSVEGMTFLMMNRWRK